MPNADLADLIERARQFLAEHAREPVAAPRSSDRLEGYVHTLDERDIEQARDYSRQYPTHFATRIERYQDYLKAHQAGGRFISEATEAKDRILREWDAYAYRQAYDHLVAHPDDVAEVARRLREYLRDHPDGRYAARRPGATSTGGTRSPSPAARSIATFDRPRVRSSPRCPVPPSLPASVLRRLPMRLQPHASPAVSVNSAGPGRNPSADHVLRVQALAGRVPRGQEGSHFDHDKLRQAAPSRRIR